MWKRISILFLMLLLTAAIVLFWPEVLNPASGFVQNCNSTPFQTTGGPENPHPQDYSPTLGIETGMTNRALRALELFAATGMGLVVWTLQSLDFPEPEQIEPSALAEAFVKAVHTFTESHGRIDIAWAEINRLQRGELDLGLGSSPDLLHALYGQMLDDGHLRGRQGESYVMLITWDREAQVHSHSIHQYGSATLDESSPHYADQTPLFAKRELKPVWLDEAEIRAHLGREYRPGEELTSP